MTLLEISISLQLGTIIAFFSLLVIIAGGVISQWIWMRSKMAEFEVRITEIEGKISEKDKEYADERKDYAKEARIASREVTSTFTRVFTRLDEIKDELKDDINQINITCAGHDSRTRDVVVKVLKDHDIIHVR